VRALDPEPVEELDEGVPQRVARADRAIERGRRRTVTGQVGDDDVELLGEPVNDRVPPLATVTDPVDQDQRITATEPFVREHDDPLKSK